LRPLLNHPLRSASVRFITNFSAVEFLFLPPSYFLTFVLTARIVSVRLSSLLVSGEQFGFYLSLRKKNDTEKGKKIMVLNPFVFRCVKTLPFTCCSCLFFFHISLRPLYIPLLNIALQDECFARHLPFITVLSWP